MARNISKESLEQKIEKIKALETPRDGLLQPFFDVSVKFMEKLA